MNIRLITAVLSVALSSLVVGCSDDAPTEEKGSTTAHLEGDEGDYSDSTWAGTNEPSGTDTNGNDGTDRADQNDVWRCWQQTESERCYELA